MPENANNQASGSEEQQIQDTGSVLTGPASNEASAGQPENNKGQGAEGSEDQGGQNYGELEKKLGEMGQELGEYRSFFNNISPLLEKLDQNPELTQAILDGKIDNSLARSVLEGKVSPTDAQAVSQASEEVKSEVGEQKMETMKREDIEKLVEERADKIRQEMEEKTELKDFEDQTQRFIENTPDFTEYAEAIDKWLDEHDVTDIKIAYYAVKGELSEAEAKKAADSEAARENQNLVQNAQGGGVSAQETAGGRPIIDELVGGPTNPLY